MKTRTAGLGVALLLFAVSCAERGRRTTDEGVPDRFAGRLEPCEWPGYDGRVYCGVLDVPEDRSMAGSRIIGLRVAVLPATAEGRPEADALTFLAGGGVVPATRYLPFLATALPRLRTSRDIVLVDQRGTGGSNPLECELPEPWETQDSGGSSGTREQAHLAALRTCRTAIAARADPTLYTTTNAADDLDAVRRWLGYERLSLWGASYGTKLARVFVRRHPEAVRAAVLHGVVPIEFSMWPGLFSAADSAFGELVTRCEADPACGAAYPDVEEKLRSLTTRLERQPAILRVSLEGSASDSVEVPFDRRSLAGLVTGMLRRSRDARSLPALLDQLDRGDYSRVAAMQRAGAPSPIPRGVYLSIACAEEMARLTDLDFARARARTRFGAGEWLDEERAECEVWGSAPVPEEFWDPVVSDLPFLIITGAEDYVTPPGYAERVAEYLSHATVRVAPQRGHDDIDPCLLGLIEEFLIQARDTSPGLGCPEDTESLSFEMPGG